MSSVRLSIVTLSLKSVNLRCDFCKTQATCLCYCVGSVGGCCPCIAPVPSPARLPPRAAIGPRFPAHLVATTNPRADTARHGDPAAWRYMACHHPPPTPALSLRHVIILIICIIPHFHQAISNIIHPPPGDHDI